MGSGIARVFAEHGFPTLLFDVNPPVVTNAEKTITANLQQLVSKNRITAAEAATTISHLTFTSAIDDCRAGFIVEAVIEDSAIKTNLINHLFSINDEDTVIVTNTSSLSVTDIASRVSSPPRFAGMHFFNPAPLMKLVEVVKTPLTSGSTISHVIAVAQQINKTPVLCKDSPGFIVNRVARPNYLEALYLLEKKYSDVKSVDALMEATGFRMGPFRLMDLIGNDINYSVSQIVYESLGRPARLKPSPLQHQKVLEGLLGRKTGKGYYEYPGT